MSSAGHTLSLLLGGRFPEKTLSPRVIILPGPEVWTGPNGTWPGVSREQGRGLVWSQKKGGKEVWGGLLQQAKGGKAPGKGAFRGQRCPGEGTIRRTVGRF
ncbi:MAG: hypothetical protein Kow0069_11760 [Promethearchaeota archaeon]